MLTLEEKFEKGLRVSFVTEEEIIKKETFEDHVVSEFSKTIPAAEKGLRKITEERLKKQEILAKKSLDFPTLPDYTNLVGVKKRSLTPDYCQNGDMNRCPAPCGACLFVKNPNAIMGEEQIYGEILDVNAYRKTAVY